MIDLLLLSLSVFIVYLSYTLFSIKMIPISLSDTYYQLEKVDKPKWLFQLCMFLTSALLLPCCLVISPENIQFLVFLGCGGLLFVSVAPAFKLPLEGPVHYVSSYISGGCAVLWVLWVGLWYIPVSLLVVALLFTFIKYKKQVAFLLELVAIISVFISLLMMYYK